MASKERNVYEGKNTSTILNKSLLCHIYLYLLYLYYMNCLHTRDYVNFALDFTHE